MLCALLFRYLNNNHARVEIIKLIRLILDLHVQLLSQLFIYLCQLALVRYLAINQSKEFEFMFVEINLHDFPFDISTCGNLFSTFIQIDNAI